MVPAIPLPRLADQVPHGAEGTTEASSQPFKSIISSYIRQRERETIIFSKHWSLSKHTMCRCQQEHNCSENTSDSSALQTFSYVTRQLRGQLHSLWVTENPFFVRPGTLPAGEGGNQLITATMLPWTSAEPYWPPEEGGGRRGRGKRGFHHHAHHLSSSLLPHAQTEVLTNDVTQVYFFGGNIWIFYVQHFMLLPWGKGLDWLNECGSSSLWTHQKAAETEDFFR